jgi:hypothetical protein
LHSFLLLVLQGIESNSPEVVCQSDKGGVITSGGGFSSLAAQPAYQKAAVAGYFASVSGTSKAPVPGYNETGRGFPDLTQAGAAYRVYIGGIADDVYGTSASAPVVAAMISLVNAARFTAGKSSVGWVNPILYGHYSSFTNDITSGKNNCASSSKAISATCCPQGYSAGPGWDPVSGLGSLDYKKFVNFMMAATTASPPTMKPSSARMSPFVRSTATPSVRATAIPSRTTPSVRATAIPSRTMPSVKATAIPSRTMPSVKATAIPSRTMPSVRATAIPSRTTPSVRATAIPSRTTPSVRATAIPSSMIPSGMTPSVRATVKPSTVMLSAHLTT